jgi:UDPglucose 6-dehydrogenase
MTNICVVGAGYVGLTTAACLSSLGHNVTCIDVDKNKIALLNNGVVPFLESGLEIIVQDMLESERLTFVEGYPSSLSSCEFAFICVPTPQSDDGSADLSFVVSAVKSLSTILKSNSIIINKSTAPVGSTQVIEGLLQRKDIYVVSNPEFLREGSAVQDFMHPDRIVIGSSNEVIAERVSDLFKSIKSPVIVCDSATAETIKYAANAFLATKLTFANAIAALCEHIGADIDVVMQGIGTDTRIGPHFLKPGPGWGGSCFPKDAKALIHTAHKSGYDFSFLRNVVESNELEFHRIVSKIRKAIGEDLQKKVITILGLTFKAGTNDLRNSPALRITEILETSGAYVQCYDPTVIRSQFSFETFDSSLDACRNSEVVLIATEWEEFSSLDPKAIGSIMRRKNVIDGRNILNAAEWIKAGFRYQGIGR